jgi:hypothetical protein
VNLQRAVLGAVLTLLLSAGAARADAAVAPGGFQLVEPASVSPLSAAVGGRLWITLQGSGLQSLAIQGVGFASTSAAALVGGGATQSVPLLRVVLQQSDRMVLETTVPATDSQGQPWKTDVAWQRAYLYLSPSQSDSARESVVIPFAVRDAATPALWALACLLAIFALVTWVSRSLEAAPAGGRIFNSLGALSLTALFAPLIACTGFLNLSLWHASAWLLLYGVGAVGLLVVVIQDFKRDLLIDFLVGDSGTYSISLCQVFFWTLIVFLGTIYVWLITGALLPVTDQILVLLGITGASHITARAVGGGAAAGATDPATVSPQLSDLFTDFAAGRRQADLTKLQMFLWTIITGVKLFYGAVHDYQWSNLSNEYLMLIGVSNSLYLGSKIVAGQAASAAPAPAADDQTPSAPFGE